MRYYTNVNCIGNFIYYRGIDNGRPVKLKIAYRPTLYLPSKKPTKYTNLQGDYLDEMQFDSINEARDFLRQYENVEGFSIYGNTRFDCAFISDQHPEDEIEWNINEIAIAYLDIEVSSENGFPHPEKAEEPITAITIKSNLDSSFHVFGCGDYRKHKDNIHYTKCKDEIDLLRKFIEYWTFNCPNIMTGWNIKGFDIPYLYNRIVRILGEKEAVKLSPWNKVYERKDTVYGKETIGYDIIGISTLDYMQLYRKYEPGGNQHESFRLDAIAQEEGVGQKLSFDEYDNLHQLYKQNFQKFIEYNIRDVEIPESLERKGRLIEMALTLAYDNKHNYDDVFMQVRMWDTITYNYLRKKNIIIPPKEQSFKDNAYEGAYVKDPQIGMFDWVASFDLNSLYPHLMIQYNISPETIIEPEYYTDEMRTIVSQINVDSLLKQKVDLSSLKGTKITITPNGQFFRTDKQGFLPEIMEKMYNDRTVYKKKMIEAQKEYQAATDESVKKEINNRIARYKNLQLAKKVSLNSAYGALGSQYFRFYDIRLALAITLSGQLSIRWIENRINAYMNNLLKTDQKDYVIASDTDSIYLHLGKIVSKIMNDVSDPKKVIDFMDRVCEDRLQPYIDTSYQILADYVNAYAQKMKMKREALADKAIWTAKKRYILNVYNSEGVVYAEPSIKIQGLEAIKSSTPSACRDKIKTALNIILNKQESDLHIFIENFRNEFKTLPAEEIAFPRSMNGLHQYADKVKIYSKGTPIHVRGALIFNHSIKTKKLEKRYELITDGEKVKFIYLKEPNIFHSDVISFLNRVPKEFDLHKVIDYDTQFDKSFVEPIRIILECIGWKTEKRNTLEAFFT